MVDSVEAPAWLVAHAREFAASGRQPVPPKLASTVALLRSAAAGFEVYVIRRVATMAFAAGM